MIIIIIMNKNNTLYQKLLFTKLTWIKVYNFHFEIEYVLLIPIIYMRK